MTDYSIRERLRAKLCEEMAAAGHHGPGPTFDQFEKSVDDELREFEARCDLKVAELQLAAARYNAERRERIATAVFAALLSRSIDLPLNHMWAFETTSRLATKAADTLIAALESEAQT